MARQLTAPSSWIVSGKGRILIAGMVFVVAVAFCCPTKLLVISHFNCGSGSNVMLRRDSVAIVVFADA